VVGVGVIFFAVLAFLLWHRKRHLPNTTPANTARVPEDQIARDEPFEKDAKAATTITSIAPITYPPEPPSEHTQLDSNYKSLISPADSQYYPPLSPSPAYTEIANTVAAAEIDTLHRHQQHTPGHQIPHTGFIEADSTPLSHKITSPASELEGPSFAYHELPTAGPSAHELASSPSAAAAATAPWKGGQGEAKEGGGGEEGGEEGEDLELARMKAEIEALRVEKEREKRLMDIAARERELSRKIVERELRGAGGSGGHGGAS
jgi:hypothetical protein